MNARNFAVAAVALGIVFAGTLTFFQTETRAETPKSPGWFLAGTAPDPGGRLAVYPGGRVAADTGGSGRGGFLAACTDDAAKYCDGRSGIAARTCLTQ
ncbi:MAG TPA: hypothetical protein VK776_18585, partial [Bryobacteraceae bacterium]|nr:hypothetical protein [Bryobacteraceae bacterium]